jgi:peptidyl-dipeptidase A
VADKLVELVEVRNQAARAAGFTDYYELRLVLGEQDPVKVAALFQELDALTDAPFASAKAEIDATLAAHHGVTVEELRPWHYHDPYFQEVPRTLEVDLDGWYRGRDVLEIERAFWGGIGLPVDGILERSDLHAREGKQQAAFCLDVDRLGDVRVLANVEDDEYWNGTMLHELGHAVYDAGLDPELPWLLRAPAHSMTTEAVALLFGRLSKDPLWMGPMLGLADADLDPVRADLRESQRLLQLVFARWSLVMVEFERALYADPHRDLQDLWWSLVEEHQGLTRPEGREGLADWATKVHVISSPAYYHNYVMGELLASQLLAAMAADLGGGPVHELSLVGRPEVGAWMRERVFLPGAQYRWDELVPRATGEPLTARHWVVEFVESR